MRQEDTLAADDSTLVRRARDKDEAAFTALVERHQARVYQHALRMLGNPQDAEEVLQDTFVQVYRGLGRFEERSRFSTWVYRIATNEALMRLRKASRRREKSLEETPVGEAEQANDAVRSFARSAVDDVMDRELREILRRAITELAEDYRVVFVLRDVDELTNAEVAEILGLSIPAVKSRLHRARLFLRDRIAGLLEARPRTAPRSEEGAT